MEEKAYAAEINRVEQALDYGPTCSSKVRNLQAAISGWFSRSALPGMGLFGESYLLFSTGLLRPIWEECFPDCFEAACPRRLLHSLTYSVILGVITGMVVIGSVADKIGRRRGSIITISLMSSSSLLLCLATFVHSPLWLFRSMSSVFFVFGVGVGGEYPLAAASAAEKSMEQVLQRHGNKTEESSRMIDGVVSEQESRGREVLLVFTMQGAGIWFNSLTLTLLLAMTGQTEHGNYNSVRLILIWRLVYLIGAGVLLCVALFRYRYLEESKVWEINVRNYEDRSSLDIADLANNESLPSRPGAQRNQPQEDIQLDEGVLKSSSTISSLSNPTATAVLSHETKFVYGPSEPGDRHYSSSLLLKHYGMRLFGASASWLLWDIAFYGNKLFQSDFILALTGNNTTLFHFALCALLNSTVALIGYFGAAILIDSPSIGRLRLQCFGLLFTGLFFITCGFCFNALSNGWLVTVYLVSTFFGQLGPNATTFLIPAEIFPTEMRSRCHGLCAASGKLGALIAAISFNYLESKLDFFLICGCSCFLACIITFWTIPESKGLGVFEIDKKWRLTVQGQCHLYNGAAAEPRYLSLFERWQVNRKHRVVTSTNDFDWHNFS